MTEQPVLTATSKGPKSPSISQQRHAIASTNGPTRRHKSDRPGGGGDRKDQVPVHKWVPVPVDGSRPPPRYAHTATLLKFSQFLVFGGTDGSRLFNDVHIFQVATSSWQEKKCRGDLPSARCLHSAFRHRKRLFVIGGKCVAPGASTASAWLNDAYVLDLKTFVWSKVKYGNAAPPGTKMQISFKMRDTKIMFFGGSKMREGKKLAAMNAAHVFDLSNRTWEEVRLFGDNPPMRSYQSVTLIKHDVWMFGGYNGLKRFDDTFSLALRGNIWRAVKKSPVKSGAAASTSRDSPYPSTRYHHFAVALDHYLCIIAGFSSKWLCDVYVLNTVTQKWRAIAMQPCDSKDDGGESIAALPREAFTGTLVGHELYLFGGSIRGKSFNDVHVLNLGECVGKSGAANPLTASRLQRQRQNAQRNRSGDNAGPPKRSTRLRADTIKSEDRSATVTIHEIKPRRRRHILDEHSEDVRPRKSLRGRRLDGRHHSESFAAAADETNNDDGVLSKTTHASPRHESRWHGDLQTAHERHSRSLRSMPSQSPSERRHKLRAPSSIVATLDDSLMDALVSPLQYKPADVRGSLNLDIVSPNGRCGPPQYAQPRTISVAELAKRTWDYGNGDSTDLSEYSSERSYADAHATENLEKTITALGSAVASGQFAVHQAKEKVEELQETLSQMQVTLEKSRIKKRMSLERIQRLRAKFKTLQKKAKEKTILREKAVQQAQKFSQSIGRLSGKIHKRGLAIREQEHQTNLIMEEIKKLQEQDRQTLVRKTRLQAEAVALRESVSVLEGHLVHKQQERQQSEVQSKFLRQRITELTAEYDRQRRGRAKGRHKRKTPKSHRTPSSPQRRVHLATAAASTHGGGGGGEIESTVDLRATTVEALLDDGVEGGGEHVEQPDAAHSTPVAHSADAEAIAASSPRSSPTTVDASEDPEIINTGKLILSRALSDDVTTS